MGKRSHRRDVGNEARRKTKLPTKFSPTRLRIVAGDIRGRRIEYNGDPATRPMKERTRESVFSLLGGKLSGKFVVDLFGGTGILAFESISRGAEKAIILELARPAVTTILHNMRQLELGDRVEVHNVDTLRWLRHLEVNRAAWPDLPWVVFCCPPYRMWIKETQALCGGVAALYEASPIGSQFVCETEQGFDLADAIPEIEWDTRKYSPATVAVCTKR